MYENSPAFHLPEPASQGGSLLTEPAAPKPASGVERLYPSMVGQGQQVPKEKPKPTADDLYPSMNGEQPVSAVVVPDDIQELRKQVREQDPAQHMYPSEKSLTAVPDNAFDMVAELPPEHRADIVHEVRRIAGDLGLGNLDISGLINRAAQLQNNPVAEDKLHADAMHRLSLQFDGSTGASKALADAKTLLNRDPRAKRMILGMGLGNDFETIALLARQARKERARGRLK